MIVASHRGPVRFVRTDVGFERHPGAGGIASGLAPLLAGTGATWVAAAITDDDRAAAAAGAATADDLDLRLVDLDPDVHRLHYEVVSNATLWFLHHGLFDLPRRPVFGPRFDEAWQAYAAVNERFATEIASAADEGDIVLVQDYHLALAPAALRRDRPDLRVSLFTHTPFCGPTSVRVLPADVAAELLSSMAGVPSGFHTARWADAYTACVRHVLGPEALRFPAFAAALGPDPEALRVAADKPEARAEGKTLDEAVADRRMLLRIDRIEPSKNILRGFAAYDLLLEMYPEWRERVVFVALEYPSREGLAEYLAYGQEVELAAARVNERWATRGWQPVLLETDDCYPRSIAALQRYDVLLVNPVRDGLNLVAKEGPLLNERDGVVALSREAGAHDEMAEAVIAVHPFDVSQTAAALYTALAMPEPDRAARAAHARELAGRRTARTWLDDLLANTGG